MDVTKISWADATFNPWWGCIEVSPACDNCYARTFAKRVGQNVWGPAGSSDRRFFADKHWAEPLKWNTAAEKAGVRTRVFCASMADVFEQNAILDEHRLRLWALIEVTPHLDWMLLTKRPQNIKAMVPPAWLVTPRDNVWYGTTVENQHYADLRVPILLDVPATVRFLSMEPLLGPVDLERFVVLYDANGEPWTSRGDLHWIITGGESGPHARPTHPAWLRGLRDQCQEAGVAFHFKQWGAWTPDGAGQVRVSGTRYRFESKTFLPDGTEYDPLKPEAYTLPNMTRPGITLLFRKGNHLTGRLLDGREHNELPASRGLVGAGA
jgi:protein gp37